MAGAHQPPVNLLLITDPTDQHAHVWAAFVEAHVKRGIWERLLRFSEPFLKYVAPLTVVVLLGLLQVALWYGVGMVPIGGVVAWPTTAAIPNGWRVCDGGAVPFNGKLWERLRGLYGNPEHDEPTLIALPNFQGYFLRGAGAQHVAGKPKSGEEAERIGTTQGAQVSPQHIFWRTSWNPGTKAVHPVASEFAVANADSLDANGIDKHGQPFVATVASDDLTQTGSCVWPMDTRPANYAVQWIMRIE